jgi:2-dehydro-3-deoxyphosphogluconate aldolase/(4S)-4-hydroxy-2-oxoglutarate aldolase
VSKEAVRSRIEEIGIVPAVRVSSAADALFAAETLAESGIPIAEITMTTPGAILVISTLTRNNPGLIVGGGSIIDMETALRCIDAGARFLTSPGPDVQLVEYAVKHSVVVFPGALTPGEVMGAWKAGADLVKVFPCSLMGGAGYIRTLKSPFPDIPLIGSGGVTQTNCADFILAGAAGVGIGRDLVNAEAVQRRQKDWIRELAGRFLKIVKEARALKGG